MADAVRSRVIGGDELKRALKGLDQAASRDALTTAVTAGAKPIQNAAKARAPKKTRTLERSITTVVEADANHAEAQIGPSGVAAAYAAQREFGGTITAKNGQALHWTDEDGQEHFAKSVTQPARPYMRPAWDENVEQAVERMTAVLRLQIERASKA